MEAGSALFWCWCRACRCESNGIIDAPVATQQCVFISAMMYLMVLARVVEARRGQRTHLELMPKPCSAYNACSSGGMAEGKSCCRRIAVPRLQQFSAKGAVCHTSAPQWLHVVLAGSVIGRTLQPAAMPRLHLRRHAWMASSLTANAASLSFGYRYRSIISASCLRSWSGVAVAASAALACSRSASIRAPASGRRVSPSRMLGAAGGATGVANAGSVVGDEASAGGLL